MFCDTWNFFPARLPVKVFKTLNSRQSYILSKFHKIERKNSLEYKSVPTSTFPQLTEVTIFTLSQASFLSVFFTQIQRQQKFIKVFPFTYTAHYLFS